MIDILNVATFAWLLFWAALAIRKLTNGTYRSVLFVIVVHFALSGIPLLLDLVFGQPEYLKQPGFYLATRDNTTAIVYCLYASMAPVLWWWTGQARRHQKITTNSCTTDDSILLRRLRPVLYISLVSPLIALVLAPDPQLYLTYGAVPLSLRQTESMIESATYYSQAIAPLSYLSLLAGFGLLLSNYRLKLSSLMFLLPWITLSVWLNGKRNIFAVALLLFGYVLLRKGYLRNSRLIVTILLIVIIMGTFSYGYNGLVKAKYTQSSTPTFEEIYEGIRIDYGRDDVIKMTIFAELYPEIMQILESRGQSLLFYATMYMPREIWPEKPLPYAQYFTSAMLLSRPKMWGWSMTTSWLEEAIANFGWLGIILGPLTLSLICRIGDAQRSSLVQMLTILVALLLLTVHLVAFSPIFFLWVFMVLWAWRLRVKTKWDKQDFLPRVHGSSDNLRSIIELG